MCLYVSSMYVCMWVVGVCEVGGSGMGDNEFGVGMFKAC